MQPISILLSRVDQVLNRSGWWLQCNLVLWAYIFKYEQGALKALEKNSISQVKQMYGWTSFTYYIPTFRVTMNSDLSEELVPAYYSTDSKNQAHM